MSSPSADDLGPTRKSEVDCAHLASKVDPPTAALADPRSLESCRSSSTRRGYSKVTPEGKKVIEAKPKRIDNSFLSQFEAFEKFKQKAERSLPRMKAETQPSASTQTPDEMMRGAHSKLGASLAQELWNASESPARFFERLIVNCSWAWVSGFRFRCGPRSRA